MRMRTVPPSMTVTCPRRRGELRVSGRYEWALGAVCLVLAVKTGLIAQPGPKQQPITRLECVTTALLSNRDLQVEQLNPGLMRAILSAAYGVYDPLLLAEGRWENSTDRGGFDPADFSRDAIYDASSDIAKAGLMGLLPSGLTYSLTADYANSSGERNFSNFDSYKITAGVLLRQPLLKNFWIDQARFTVRVNRRNLNISELGVRFMVMDVVTRVQCAYFELRQTHEQLRVQQELLESRRQMLHAVQRQLQEGFATFPDEHLAKAQVAATEASVSGARAAVALAENALRTHLGDSFTNQVDTSLFPAEELRLPPASLDLADRWRRGLAERPDLLQFRQELAKANLEIKFRRNQLFPAIDVIGSYGRKGASVSDDLLPPEPPASAGAAWGQMADGVAPSDMIGVVFTMPLSRAVERANYRASKQLRAQAEVRLKQKEELVLREISDAFHTARTSLDRAHASRRGVESARAAFQAEERRLAGGKSTLLLVLQLQDQLTNLEAAAIRAEADYNLALSQLGFADGSALEQAGVWMDAP